MNKSLITNLISLVLLAVGYTTQNQFALYAGLFAFSGAITNWLAIHMLFEKVPGLYGSGVIPARFEAFKNAIKTLMMEQFFTDTNIDRFLNQELSGKQPLDLTPIIAKVDFNPSFDKLVDVIANSQFGGMLAMFGGTEALQPMKQPFVEKMQESMVEISQSESVKNALKEQLESPAMLDEIKTNIEGIIDQRLSELTPQLVKEMVQKMIKEHLGWLVVWGGIFGGVIGLVSTFIA
ncbi:MULTISPECIES: DUF445 domain-containing protein [Vibrio]|jgi:uncharacterized membrane protein YheB (UPF0754 family)|uniref:DUF445 domain-containing protein n=1 Tax=Vibrio diazotrophicus TaxID=685 RepID=A0A2J8HKC8_VIBDI|nr:MULTISPECIES: DUF445 domain-containing protein [Vibrio]MBD0786063.1 DUF445 domain-containing protein [Vibrio sp. Y2-5]MCF7362337.1 DUF445 domain-containing protein [Vibrio sp. A1-b2]NIY92722.1 DUF445 domain-containing protein [Vibrio diazotrophicus]PNH83053.1 DUF445 domain-containing protein [Vibrio diazotrophicus]PNH93894.1 DUF445 domain-containing protein [Vibrio diazotrophicus]